MPKVLKFQLTCPECHQKIEGQMEAPVSASSASVSLFLNYWQTKHERVCPSKTVATPVIDGTVLYGEYGQELPEHPTRSVFVA